ncbi:hypothetical protein [Campylobacter fetus]|uniref:hypothetical protein n=2 Tax=Campylobacter fetus TaxID=196 RepID=UPI0003E32A75|nr:hypothetical protein [Campylobacter fetus]OCS25244.1 hypothetical protein CFVB10_09460 [Campylobacter fetus subsp. venerealis cfvB10]AIR80358.1 hypothetical protein CFV97608_0723 [Campylobacter fetus subsp. venerealis 97/608]AIR80960.1 hypothetical protein CFV97608_1343 [Campylobacter fetus subsp. venerealis 97/608]EAJ5705215.1 hypothetical protein [Campylobacter fetus]OCS25959.1 hypothetical protein CFV33872_09570 [Campylobacter fetus subsp. venerealis CCUG 33872]
MRTIKNIWNYKINKIKPNNWLLNELIASAQWDIKSELEKSDKEKNKLINLCIKDLGKTPKNIKKHIEALEAYLNNKLVYSLTEGFWKDGKQEEIKWVACRDITDFFYLGVQYKVENEYRQNNADEFDRQDGNKIIGILKAYLEGKKVVKRTDFPKFKEDLEWEYVGNNYHFNFTGYEFRIEGEEFVESRKNLYLPNKPVEPVDLEFIKFREPATYRIYKTDAIKIAKFEEQPYVFTTKVLYDPNSGETISVWVAMIDSKKVTKNLEEQIEELQSEIFNYELELFRYIGVEHINKLNDFLKSNKEFLKIYDESELKDEVYKS